MPRPSSASATSGCMLVPGPLYHNGPIGLVVPGAAARQPRGACCHASTPRQALAAIERHGVDVVYLVPTMMKRIWRLADDVRLGYDLSSLRIVWHLAEPCPPWLKEAWIDWLGPERIYELYAGTEAQAATIITGVEWLEHRGSVGRAEQRRDEDLRRRRQRAADRRAGRGVDALCHETHRPTATSAPRRRRSTAAGSRSATSAGSTRTATSTSATGCRT